MRTVTFNHASLDLGKIIDYSLETKEEINIASENGAVVLLPQEDYESMLETLRLISDKKALKSLLESHMLRDRGDEPKTYSVGEVFGDI